jgi:hypothetical protein
MKMTTMKTQRRDDEDDNNKDDDKDTTKTTTTTMGLGNEGQRGALTPLPFWFLFFSVSFLFSLLTSYFLFYSYNINDNMPPWQVAMEGSRGTGNRPEVTDDTPCIWGL